MQFSLPADAAAMVLLATNWFPAPILGSHCALVRNGLLLAASHREFMAVKYKQK